MEINNNEKSIVKTLHFTYDPFRLTKQILQIYTEKFIQNKNPPEKATQFACYDFIQEMTESEFDEIMNLYSKKFNVEVITFKDWQSEAKDIFTIIFKHPKYVDIYHKYLRMGLGFTGLGVFDKSKDEFYECDFAEHWTALRKILKESYPDKSEAFYKFEKEKDLDTYKSIRREDLEDFILDNFEFIGKSKSLECYLK